MTGLFSQLEKKDPWVCVAQFAKTYVDERERQGWLFTLFIEIARKAW
jgi:hypothetical protein